MSRSHKSIEIALLALILLSSGCSDRASTAIERGKAAYENGDTDLSLSYFNEAIRLDPSSPEAHYGLGSGYRSKGEWSKAIAEYTEVIRLNPKFADAFSSRALCLSMIQEFDRALKDSNEAIRLQPDGAKHYYRRGLVFNNLHFYSGGLSNAEKAISDFTEAMNRDISFGQAFAARGDMFKRIGRESNADSDYSRAKSFGVKVD